MVTRQVEDSAGGCLPRSSSTTSTIGSRLPFASLPYDSSLVHTAEGTPLIIGRVGTERTLYQNCCTSSAVSFAKAPLRQFWSISRQLRRSIGPELDSATHSAVHRAGYTTCLASTV